MSERSWLRTPRRPPPPPARSSSEDASAGCGVPPGCRGAPATTRWARIAATGWLRVSERRAVDLIQAAGIGVIQTLLATPLEHRDPGLADELYEAVLQQILTGAPDRAESRPTAAVVALRATAPGLDMLTGAERQLLVEWLDRASASLQTSAGR